VEIGKLPVTESGESGWQGCNLSEINGGLCDTPEKFYLACRMAAALGTLQAGYTDFEFLTAASKEIFEREALIGVSITGWMNNPHVLFDEEVLRKGAEIVKETNKIVAKMIGINQAARTTCAKPSGNASAILMTASGVHGEHAPRYLRHAQFNNEMEVLQAFKKLFPAMVEDSVWSINKTDSVIAFPIISKEGSIYKNDLLGVKQLEYVKKAQQVWVEAGTNVELCRHPKLRHNISNTISVDDWAAVTEYLYENRQWFCGVSLMAASGDKAFPQAPFTEVLTETQIVEKYGAPALFAAGVVTRALDAFGDLWKAISTAQGYGEDLSSPTHENSAKRDWVRQFLKFAANSFPTEPLIVSPELTVPRGDLNKTGDLLKDVYNLHKWTKITQSLDTSVDIRDFVGRKQFVDVGTLSGAACAGGACDITF
jgi:ribonucleoside-triphosphate reductase